MLPERVPDLREAARAVEAAGRRLPVLTVALALAMVLLITLYPARSADGRDPAGGGEMLLVVTLGLLLITVALWAHWFYAIYRGVCALRIGRYLRMWGVLGWFIPYATLFVPKQMVNDLWRPGGKVPGVVQAWWVAWLVAAIPASLGRLNPLPRLLTYEIAWAALVAGSGLGVWTARTVTDRLERLVRDAASVPLDR